MSKRHADSTLDDNAPKRETISAEAVLVAGARYGDAAAVRAGLEKLIPDTDNRTVVFDAVHEACRGNHHECLALLLPSVETTQMGFGILLSECVHADHTACTEVLLQHWKSVCSNVAHVPLESNNTNGCPALWSDPAVCQVLIDAGADIETKDHLGRSPLLLACRSGALDVVKLLVKAGARVRATDKDGDTCLIFALYHGHIETVRYLVGLPDVDVNHANNYWLNTALHWAIERKNEDVVRVLIDAGADIEAESRSGRPLYLASGLGVLAIVDLLVRAGAGVSRESVVACLMAASSAGERFQTEVVFSLLCLPEVDVNHVNDEGKTALHLAVEHRHADVVQVLIDAGADIEATDRAGCSPLLLASSPLGSAKIVKQLVEAGAGVHAVDPKGNTCLLLAALRGHTDTVRYLAGLPEVNLNHADNKGYTALHLAVKQKHAEVMQVLLDAGADNTTARSPRGRRRRTTRKGWTTLLL